MHLALKYVQRKSLARVAPYKVVARLLVDQVERVQCHALHLADVTCRLQLRLVF
jgi:hypothetical protein